MSLLEQIKSRKSRLHSCETVITTPSGCKYKEKMLADGTLVASQPQHSTSPGYVVDIKPDLQVAVILPGLFMGSQDVVQETDLLRKHSITHVLSLGIKPDVLDDKLAHKYVNLLDIPETDLISSLEECFSFIDNAMTDGGCIFVHCNAGISRSASVVIAYLMKNKDMTYQQAYLYLKERRSVIKPNPGFVQQLKDYQKQIGMLDKK